MATTMNLIANLNDDTIERMDTSFAENSQMLLNDIDSSVGSLIDANNAENGGNVTGIREREINQPSGLSTPRFLDCVNAMVGAARTPIQKRRMRELQLNHMYKILAIKPLNTSQYGRQIIAHLISLEENVEFKVFLPSRMISLFPDEEAIEQFLSRISGLKVLSLSDNNSVNMEFIRNEEDEVDNTSHRNDDEFFSSVLVWKMASREELINQLIRLHTERRCLICLNAKKNMAFACGHAACRSCAEAVDECHICRRSITIRIPLY